MAIYHLSMKTVSRASGRSAVGAAAYRSGTRLTNERDGLTHDYTRKGGIEHSEIVLPEDSKAEWARDRETLWNAAEADDATKAFEALRKSIDRRNTATTAELKTIRKGVEALFDQIEALQAKPDYAADLAQLKQLGVVVAKRLEALEASPALKLGINAFERAGTELVRTSAQAFDQKAQRFDYAASALERITKNINDRHTYRRYAAIAGGAGVVLGALLLLFLPRLFPFNADSHVAAAIMGKSRWDAGAAIMHASDPDGWKRVIENEKFSRDNADVLARCRQLAAKKGETQRCSLAVRPSDG